MTATLILPDEILDDAEFALETNPMHAMLDRYERAAAALNLDPGIDRILRQPEREITVALPVMMDNGRIEVFTGYRVVHNTLRGPGKGGVRYSLGVTPDRVAFATAWASRPTRCARSPHG
jgi:glutamate dehydrogenase (NAD(P)+)